MANPGRLSAAQRIGAAMKENEKQVLTAVSGANSKGQLYRMGIGTGTNAWMNAIVRLEEDGKIRFVRGSRVIGGWAIMGRSIRGLR